MEVHGKYETKGTAIRYFRITPKQSKKEKGQNISTYCYMYLDGLANGYIL